MENQHRHIKGCRELSQEEISMMNRIKEKEAELLALHAELVGMLDLQNSAAEQAAQQTPERYPGGEYTEPHKELRRLDAAEPYRWASIGKTDIQTGIMALVRAVAQPAGV